MSGNAAPPRVVVIGAGLVGSSMAAHAASSGAEVVLLDAYPGPGQGTSKWSYAWFNSNNKNPDWYHRLNVRGMDEYPHLARRLGDRTWYHPVGHLMWSDKESWLWPGDDRLSVEERVGRLRRLGYPVEPLSRDEVRHLEPDVRTEAVPEESFLFPSEGWIDTVGLVNALLRWGQNAGSLECRWSASVNRFVFAGDRVRALVTDTGAEIAGDVFVNCAGVNASTVARLAGVEVRTANRSALVGISKETTARLGRVLHAGEMSVRPHPGGRLLLHRTIADESVVAGTAGYEVPAGEIQGLLDGAKECLDAEDLQLDRVAMVDMPVPADGRPAIGALAPWHNLFLASMHSGATIGALMGRLLAEHIVLGTWDDALSNCAPERLTKTEASPETSEVE